MNREAERNRLVELLSQFERTCPDNCTGLEKSCTQCVLEQKADHLLDDGWMRPLVKVGDVVYALWETPTLHTEAKYVLYSAEVKEVCHCKRNNRLVLMYKLEPTSFRGRIREFSEYDFGKIFFTSREDAEKALKGESEK